MSKTEEQTETYTPTATKYSKKKKNSTIERIPRFFFFSLVRKAFPVEIILVD